MVWGLLFGQPRLFSGQKEEIDLRTSQRRKELFSYALILPGILLLLVVVFLPFLQNIFGGNSAENAIVKGGGELCRVRKL